MSLENLDLVTNRYNGKRTLIFPILTIRVHISKDKRNDHKLREHMMTVANLEILFMFKRLKNWLKIVCMRSFRRVWDRWRQCG